MKNPRESVGVNALVRMAVVCALVGLLCVSLFLWRGFAPWSVGLGIFLGVPLLFAGVLLYLLAVVRDLRQRGIL